MSTRHDEFMALAQAIARNSKDRSRKTGCVIVSPSGQIRGAACNSFPNGCADTDARHERPAKYQWTEHAERNAIYAAAREGVHLDGCTAYVPWYPCCDCARALIQSGIRTLVAFEPDLTDPRWGADFAVVRQMLAEAGVIEVIVPGVMGAAV